jgi:hypothetical protein
MLSDGGRSRDPNHDEPSVVAMPVDGEIGDTRKEIQSLALAILRRGLTVPAIVLLELLQPLSFVGSQILLVAAPLFGVFGDHAGRHYAWLLADRRNVTQLLEALERQRHISHC